MNEKIEVRYAPIAGQTFIRHKYIVYTDSNGYEFAARGGPTPDIFGLGDIQTVHDTYDENFKDWDPEDDDPRETIAESSNLATEWMNIKSAMDLIAASGLEYIAEFQNSNTVVDTALDSTGLNLPQNDDYGENWSPASGIIKNIFGANNSPGNILPNNSKNGQKNGENQASPLVLDLDGDGIELTSLLNSGVYFDLDQDGFAEQTGWVSADDGILVIDKNSNGKIDDITELFGTKNSDGFAILNPFDTNNDGIIDLNDSQWSDLRIWTDTNLDGRSEITELHTLNSLNIASLNLTAQLTENPELVSGHDLQGNTLTHLSSYISTSGQERALADVWFSYDNQHSVYKESFPYSDLAFYLPEIKGYGQLADISIALSIDNYGTGNLQDLLLNFVDRDVAEYFTTDSFVLDQDIQDLLFRWANVDTIDPNSRGTYVDARKIAFVEAYNGDNFTQYDNSNPRVNAGSIIDQTFNYIADVIKMQLVVQMIGEKIFENKPLYNVNSAQLEGELVLSLSGIDFIETLASASSTPNNVWINFTQF